MALDPAMRRWNINLQFNDDGRDLDSDRYLQLYLDLTKAKAKHSEYGHIDDIEMNVFYINYSLKETCSFGCIFADNIINHWKNNIVKLSLCLTGHELFLSDPTLNLPRLKKLQISKSFPISDVTKAHAIASALLVNQSKSLEDLELGCINPEIKENIPINKLTVRSVTQSTLVSVLNCTNESLECLELQRIHFFSFECPELKLKELTCVDTTSRILQSVITSCQQSLKSLTIDQMYQDKELVVPPLNLRTFSVRDGAYEFADLTKFAKNVTSIINSSCSTLEELDITNYGNNYNLDVNSLPKLKTFETRATSADLVKTIIKSSFKTLSVLKLDNIQHPENVIT